MINKTLRAAACVNYRVMKLARHWSNYVNWFTNHGGVIEWEDRSFREFKFWRENIFFKHCWNNFSWKSLNHSQLITLTHTTVMISKLFVPPEINYPKCDNDYLTTKRLCFMQLRHVCARVTVAWKQAKTDWKIIARILSD